ncbi:MAG: hypothetical protein JNK15_24605 [Planctomycetes bacterium]|nr:hypothetical protein [Planctomycetota bacterium]
MRRRLLAVAAVWFACAAFVTVAVPDAQDRTPVPFSHKQHVDEVWFALDTAEVWRDCRGCHVFDEKRPTSAPQEHCDACHGAGNLAKDYLPGWDKDLGKNTTRTRDAFRHHTHGMLECRECHLPNNVTFLKDFDVVTGPGQCARCHDPALGGAAAGMVASLRWFRGAQDETTAKALGVPFRAPVAPADHAAYAQKLVEVFAGPTGGINTTKLPVGGDFDHYDHGAIACDRCHTNIRTATATEVGTGTIPADGCATCHVADVQKTGARAATAARKEVRPLWSLGAFAHGDHYAFLQPGAQRKPGVANAAAYDAIANSKTNGCEVCHTQDLSGVGLPQRDFPFGRGKSKNLYLDCTSCHDGATFATGETPQKALHDSTDGAEDGKNGWTGCASCHVFGQKDFAAQRPTAEATRLQGRTFSFPANTHPDITRLGIDRSGRQALADCASCHRAKVQALPTRLEQKAFRHATHLPKNATENDCKGCHPSAVTAATAGELASADFRTYTLDGCTTCHTGGAVTEVAGPAPQKRSVVAFPHGPHAKAGAKCTDCHELAADGGDAVTKPKALDCSQCHDHVAGGCTTEQIFGDQVRSCRQCHHDPGTAAPPALAIPSRRGTPAAALDARYTATQNSFAGFVDSQFHPVANCKDCHRADLAPDPKWPGVRVPRADHIKAASTSPHRGSTRKEPAECLRCHWKPMNGLSDGVDAGTPEEREWRRQPTSPATRAKFGNERDGYPGTPRAKG